MVAFGGDHATAMGLWKGVMSGPRPSRRLGLIWIDAHMDAHNFLTLPTGNAHGMPVAALLGESDPLLKAVYGDGPHLRPENLALVGVRSCEPEERRLLDRLGVACYPMKTVRRLGLASVLRMALSHVTEHADRFGISIDLDAVDPGDAPAVGTPVDDGLSGMDLCNSLADLNGEARLVGLEIVEYAPGLDRERRTQRLIADLVASLYGTPSRPKRSFGSLREGIRSIS